MISELEGLNDNFYRLLCALDNYKGTMSDDQYQYMNQVLLEQYRLQYELKFKRYLVEKKREIFELDLRLDYLVPRKWRTRIFRRRKKNEIAELFEQSIRKEEEEYVSDLCGELGIDLARFEARKRRGRISRHKKKGGEHLEGELTDGQTETDEHPAKDPSDENSAPVEEETAPSEEAEEWDGDWTDADPNGETSDETDGPGGQ